MSKKINDELENLKNYILSDLTVDTIKKSILIIDRMKKFCLNMMVRNHLLKKYFSDSQILDEVIKMLNTEPKKRAFKTISEYIENQRKMYDEILKDEKEKKDATKTTSNLAG